MPKRKRASTPAPSAAPVSADQRAELHVPAPPDYNDMTDDELRNLMRERGLGLRGRRTTMHYIMALEASDEVGTPGPAPPFSKARRAELDVKNLPDYSDRTDDELRDLLRERGLGLQGRRSREHYVGALRAGDERDRKKLMGWKRRVGVKDETKKEDVGQVEKDGGVEKESNGEIEEDDDDDDDDDVFGRKYQVDPTRKSFLDLPGEVRNRIYELALFGYGIYTPTFKLDYRSDQDAFLPAFRMWGPSYLGNLIISILDVLGITNKQIRKEARSIFYAEAHILLASGCPEDGDTHSMMHRFLEKIGPDGRSTLPVLRASYSTGSRGLDFGDTGFSSFQKTLQSVAECTNLRSLDFTLGVSQIFRGDRDALEAYFLRGEALQAPGLETLANILTSLHQLNQVHLEMLPCPKITNAASDAAENFFDFAFSGMREMMLWVEFENRLQANNINHGWTSDARKFDGKTFVFIRFPHLTTPRERDEIMDFPTWVDWREKRFPKAVEGGEVMVEHVGDDE